MMNYDYREAMAEDIKDYLSEDEITVTEENKDELFEKYNDELWTADGVTGNASGSYTFNSYKAKEYVLDNMDLAKEALEEFCVPAEEIGERFLNEDWEYLDVTIRCYLLGEVLGTVLEEMIEEAATV